MGTINRSLDVTWTPKNGVNKLFFEPVWQSMLKLDTFRVLPNISDKKKLGFIKKLTKILQKAEGCKFTPKGSMEIYDRTIEVDSVKINMEQCIDQFKDTVLAENFKKTGNMKYDLTGTEIMAYIVQLIQDSLPGEYQRLFWFGDKSSDDPTLNLTNGFWSVYAEQLVDDDLSPYVDSNSGAPLAPDDGLALLKKMYEEQAKVLKGLPASEKRFYVTNSVWEAVQNDYEALGGGDAGRVQTISGVTTMQYRGIQIIQDCNWDTIMEDDLGKVDSHLALLTTPNNLIMATNMKSDLNKVEVWYDRKDELNYIKVNGKFGTNFVHPAFFVIAY